MNSNRGLGSNILLVAFATVLSLLIAEMLCRVVGIGELGSSTWIESRVDKPNYPYQKNSKLIYQYPSNPRGYFDAKNRVIGNINSKGFRGAEANYEKKAGRSRIVFLGDSFTLGIGVRDSDTLPAQTEASIRRLGLDVEVLNFGVSGSDTEDQENLVGKYVRQFQPDVVVIVLFLNDAKREGTIRYLSRPNFMKSARKKSNFLNLLVESIERIILSGRMINHYQAGYDKNSEGWRMIKSSLHRLQNLAEINNFKLIVSVYPVLFRLDESYPFANIHSKIEEYTNTLGLEFIDLFDAFSGRKDSELWVHRVDQHPNEVAQALAGQYLASSLSDRGIID